MYGKGNWRKLKGIATIKLKNGKNKIAELHWYEAHGIGKKEVKRKRYL
jgi:nucleotidyltransferase/DNA polymerase involved in DNA repair